MIDFHNAFCQVYIKFLIVKAQNTLIIYTLIIFLLNQVK